MASILGFGHYVPERVRDNAELSGRLGCDEKWIVESSGIEERRIASEEETMPVLAERAARDCMDRASVLPAKIGLVILASGTAERRFPGPAAQLAHRLGLLNVPAIDLPVASAGSLFGLALAAQLASTYGTVLVAAAEKMSGPALAEPLDRNVAILFGDGAGACLVSSGPGEFEIIDAVLHSDGAYADHLRLEQSGPVLMDGRSVILQASRRIPAVIAEVLAQRNIAAADVSAFVMHQANRNLTERIAKVLDVPGARFFSNIRKYGNTSSASLFIAASEWSREATLRAGELFCLAAFGAGFHWGAILLQKCNLRYYGGVL